MDATSSFPKIERISISDGDKRSHSVQTSGSECPRTPVLRKRKPSKKHAVNAVDHVSDYEIAMTSLPAQACRIVNCKLRQSLAKETGKRESPLCVVASDGFHVKSANTAQYGGELNFRSLDLYPSSMCPCPEVHMTTLASYGKELPLACPTCWSLQRNK